MTLLQNVAFFLKCDKIMNHNHLYLLTSDL